MWSPVDEAQIATAIDAGDLAETHQLEIKRDAPVSKGDRSETARDLASMALDGGSLLFGVEELKGIQSFQLAPADLPGLAESPEQIAEMRIDPPLTIRVKEIPSADNPGKGYLFVTVDASPQAPHMVDGVYYGRGEKRRRRLGDAEVIRLHRNREDNEQRILAALEADIAADPIPVDDRRLGHLFVATLPAIAPTSVAERWVWNETAVDAVFRSSGIGLARDLGQWDPIPSGAHRLVSRANGQARTSRDPSSPVYEAGAVDVEFREDGSVHVFVGRLTDQPGRARDDGAYVIMHGLAVAYVLRTVNWALAVGERSGYSGAWHLAVAGTGLQGVPALRNTRSFLEYDTTVYAAPTYKSTTQATRAEMQENPGGVAGRLLNRFVRSMHLGAYYGSLLGWDEEAEV